jgi:hypothetical protein
MAERRGSALHPHHTAAHVASDFSTVLLKEEVPVRLHQGSIRDNTPALRRCCRAYHLAAWPLGVCILGPDRIETEEKGCMALFGLHMEEERGKYQRGDREEARKKDEKNEDWKQIRNNKKCVLRTLVSWHGLPGAVRPAGQERYLAR